MTNQRLPVPDAMISPRFSRSIMKFNGSHSRKKTAIAQRGVLSATAAAAIATPIIGTYQYTVSMRLGSASSGANSASIKIKPKYKRRSRKISGNNSSARPANGTKKIADE